MAPVPWVSGQDPAYSIIPSLIGSETKMSSVVDVGSIACRVIVLASMRRIASPTCVGVPEIVRSDVVLVNDSPISFRSHVGIMKIVWPKNELKAFELPYDYPVLMIPVA